MWRYDKTVDSRARARHRSAVRDYYERNTPWFLAFGNSRRSKAIHRPVWAEGVVDRQSALNYVNEQILAHIRDLVSPASRDNVRVLDLGCGVGASLHYLAGEVGQAIWGVGLTLSLQQAAMAQRRASELGMRHQCVFLVADYQRVPMAVEGELDVAFSIEALAHATDPEAYFREAACVLKPGGRLILCDDFQVAGATNSGSDGVDQRWLRLFKAGWNVPHLLARGQVTDMARSHRLRLVGDRDLTRYLRWRYFPNYLIPLKELLISRGKSLHPLVRSVLGGIALEQCLERGLTEYRLLAFEKVG